MELAIYSKKSPSKLKRSDPALLPPCKTELVQKIKRTNYVASVWRNADTSNPVKFSAHSNGWILLDGKYRLNWFDGDQIPAEICRHIDDDFGCDSESDDDSVYSTIHLTNLTWIQTNSVLFQLLL